jgi:aspartate kinase
MWLFSRIAKAKIATDMIVQNVGLEGRTDISFTVPATDLATTLDVLTLVSAEIGAERVDYQEHVAKVSVVGLGMERQGGVAEKMFRAISARQINISMITTSEIKISALVSLDDASETLRAVHSTFELHKIPVNLNKPQILSAQPINKAELNVARISGMEDIIIESINLDQNQSRITLPDVPDRPGVAAEMFERIADAGIIVDMIVQSCGRDGKAIISFTAPRSVLQKALAVTGELTKEWGSNEPQFNSEIAILTVRGTGLRSHTGLAYRMFKTLADGNINVNVISTSERSISITIDNYVGEKGLQLLKNEFVTEMM